MSRFQKIVIALLSALVVLVVAGGIATITLLSNAERQADYERCLALHGYTPESMVGMTAQEQDAMLEATEACLN